MKEKLFNRSVGIRCLTALAASLIYGLLSGSFFLRFTDGMSIASIILLFMGILNYWWKEGFFSFFTWKKRDESSIITYRETIREERKHMDNHSFYAGILCLLISLILTLIFVFVQ